MLPAGPGPYRSGFVALGQAPTGGAVSTTPSGDGAAEPWQSVATLGDCLDHCARRRGRDYLIGPRFERTYPWDCEDDSDFPTKLKQQTEEFDRRAAALETILRQHLFDFSVAFYIGAHTAWDRYNEDPLGRDHVCAIVWNGDVVLAHRMLDRYYG